MIKVAIKHFIYEKCINVLFSAISRNFNRNPRLLVVGETYKEIQLIRAHLEHKFRIDVLCYATILQNDKNMLVFRPLYYKCLYRNSRDFIDSKNLFVEFTDEVCGICWQTVIDYKIIR